MRLPDANLVEKLGPFAVRGIVRGGSKTTEQFVVQTGAACLTVGTQDV